MRGNTKDKRAVEDKIHLLIRRLYGTDHWSKREGGCRHSVLIDGDPCGVLYL